MSLPIKITYIDFDFNLFYGIPWCMQQLCALRIACLHRRRKMFCGFFFASRCYYIFDLYLYRISLFFLFLSIKFPIFYSNSTQNCPYLSGESYLWTLKIKIRWFVFFCRCSLFIHINFIALLCLCHYCFSIKWLI